MIDPYKVPAIPKNATELNYQIAINNLLHKKKEFKPTRREITNLKIKENILDHNNPLGNFNDFKSILLGKQSQLMLNDTSKNNSLENLFDVSIITQDSILINNISS